MSGRIIAEARHQAFAELPTRQRPQHSAADAAWHLGYQLGELFAPAMPSSDYTEAENSAWLAGYEAGRQSTIDATNDEQERLEALCVAHDFEAPYGYE